MVYKKGIPVEPVVLKRMTRALVHRGPDGEGLFSRGHIGFGHRRLSIIDLSENAKQPMSNEDGSVIIVFNGMIYNYRQLTEELVKKGHVFRSRSDTEAIIHLYEEFGYECVRYLRGMFAFAIWDSKKEELMLARDRVGQKPIVYSTVNGCFLFASEPKSILASGLVGFDIDPLGVDSLFAYKSVPYPKTMFSAIKKLPPASVMVVRDGQIKITTYWKPELFEKTNLSIKAAAKELYSLVDESVRLRLISDVPVGIFLSGGMDSSTVAAFAHKYSTKSIKAFSIGFENDGVRDVEFGYAEKLSRMYDLEFEKFSIDESIIDEIEPVVWHYDEPFAIAEALAHMRFCRKVGKEVKVALTGDGADEIFAGYSGYLFWKVIGDLEVLLRKKVFGACEMLDFIKITRRILPLEGIKFLLLPPEEKRAFAKRRTRNRIAGLIYSKELKEKTDLFDIGLPLKECFEQSRPRHLLDGVLFMDLVLNDAHGTCTFSDISGMANGLELRSPFLDHKLIEFAAMLPVSMKIKMWERKYILRKISAPIIPKEIMRRDKFGYGDNMPVAKWFMREWRGKIMDCISSSGWNGDGFFDQKAILDLCRMHFNGKGDYFRLLWAVYSYVEWHKVFIKDFNSSLEHYCNG